MLSGEGGAIDPAQFGTAVPGRDDRHYAFYGLGQTAIFTAALAVGAAAGVSEPRRSRWVELAWVFLLGPALLVAVIMQLTAACRSLGASDAEALRGAALVTLGAPLLWYARTGYEDALLAVCLATWLRWAVVLERNGSATGEQARAQRWMTAALSVALLTKLTMVAIALPALAWQARHTRQNRMFPGFSLAILAGTATLIGGWNLHRFGSPLQTGYGLYFERAGGPMVALGELPEHFAALWLSPHKGLLWLAPGLLAAGWGWRQALQSRAAKVALVGLLLSALAAASYTMWDGGDGYGPRFLVAPVVLAAPLLTRAPRRWTPGLLAIGLALQLCATTAPPGHQSQLRRAANLHEPGACSAWTPGCSALVHWPRWLPRALANAASDDAPIPYQASGLDVADAPELSAPLPRWWLLGRSEVPRGLSLVLTLAVLTAAFGATVAAMRAKLGP